MHTGTGCNAGCNIQSVAHKFGLIGLLKVQEVDCRVAFFAARA